MKEKLNLSVTFDGKKQKNEITIPLEFQNHMQSIIGIKLYRDSIPNEIDGIDLKDVKKLFLKYIRSLSDAFTINAQTADTQLKRQLERRFATATTLITHTKDINELYLLMIAVLGDAYFDVLGSKRCTFKEKSAKYDLILNSHRSITYSQTSQQKACQIFDFLKEDFFRAKNEEENQILKQKYKTMTADEFIHWAYSNYALVLSEIL